MARELLDNPSVDESLAAPTEATESDDCLTGTMELMDEPDVGKRTIGLPDPAQNE